MNSEKLIEFAKNPIVLAVGVALGVGLLIMASRNSGGNATGSDATLQSQSITTQANVALSGQTTQYNMAALDFMANTANAAIANHATDVNANTAITLHALANLDNLDMVSAQQELQRNQIAGSLAINQDNNATMMQAADLQARTSITLAPQAVALSTNLAKIESDRAIAIANINANSATTLATLNGANRIGAINAQSDAATTHDIIGMVGQVAPYVIGAFM